MELLFLTAYLRKLLYKPNVLAASVKIIPQTGAEVTTARQGSGGALDPTGIASNSASSCKPSLLNRLQWTCPIVHHLLSNAGMQFWGIMGKEGPGKCPQQGGWPHQIEASVPTAGVHVTVGNLNIWAESAFYCTFHQIHKYMHPWSPKLVMMSPQRGKERTMPIIPPM